MNRMQQSEAQPAESWPRGRMGKRRMWDELLETNSIVIEAVCHVGFLNNRVPSRIDLGRLVVLGCILPNPDGF